MSYSRKLILHLPLSGETLLEDFVEQCLKDGVSLLAIFGPDCARIETLIDEIVVGDGGDGSRFLCTTSHPGETFDHVLNMATMWDSERGEGVEEIRL